MVACAVAEVACAGAEGVVVAWIARVCRAAEEPDVRFRLPSSQTSDRTVPTMEGCEASAAL